MPSLVIMVSGVMMPLRCAIFRGTHQVPLQHKERPPPESALR